MDGKLLRVNIFSVTDIEHDNAAFPVINFVDDASFRIVGASRRVRATFLRPTGLGFEAKAVIESRIRT